MDGLPAVGHSDAHQQPDASQPAKYDAAKAGSSAEYAEVLQDNRSAAPKRDVHGHVADGSINRNPNAPIEYAAVLEDVGDGVYVDDEYYAEGHGNSNRSVLAGNANGSVLYSVPMEEPDAEQPSDGHEAPLEKYAILKGSNA